VVVAVATAVAATVPPLASADSGKMAGAMERNAVPSVVGRLQERWAAWLRVGASPVVVQWLREGLVVAPKGMPPPGRETTVVADPVWMDGEVARLLSEGAILEVQKRPAVLSPTRLVDKKGPKRFRLVVNMRGLNALLPVRHVKSEGLSALLRMARPGWWAVTFDLQDGYHHVPIHPSSRTYLGFAWRGRFYVFTVLPFGMSTSPWAFVKVIREAVKVWRSMGIPVHVYMDDGSVFGATRQAVLNNRDQVEASMDELGLVRAPSKGCWEPTQRFEVLGFVVDLAQGFVEVPPEKQRSVVAAVASLEKRQQATVRQIASVAGKVAALAPAWSLARMLARPLLTAVAGYLPRDFMETWDAASDDDDLFRHGLVRLVKEAYRQVVAMSPEVQASLVVIQQRMSVSVLSRPAWASAQTVEMCSDASVVGWGAVCQGRVVSGLWSAIDEVGPSQRDINWLELRAVLLGIRGFEAVIAGQMVRLYVDSRVAAAVLHKGSSVRRLQEVALEVRLALDDLGARLEEVVWIPSAANPADGPSRGLAVDVADSRWRGMAMALDDWGIHVESFARVQLALGVMCTVDAFASQESALLHRFWTVHDDAFTQDWRSEVLWMCPPLRLVHRSLVLLAQAPVRGIMIVPEWPAHIWWPLLLELEVRRVSISAQEIRTVQGYGEPLNNAQWRIWAVLLDGSKASSPPQW
jgi:hypothetical protein